MIEKIHLNCINQKTQSNVKKTEIPVTPNLKENNNFKSLYMPSGISFKGNVFALPKQTLGDIAYRTQLAQAVGTAIERLTSILAPDELKYILRTAKPENFSIGKNFENIINGAFKINLHMHTSNSDGAMTVEEMLNQAARYGDYRKKVLHKSDPVIIAITDHDCVDGAKAAVQIIANNPQRYENVRVVLGVEFNTYYNNRQIEAIGYCINPFDERLNTFLEHNSEINKNYLDDFLKNQVNKWEAIAGIPPAQMTTPESVIAEAKSEHTPCCNNIGFWGSGGLIQGFTKGLESIFKKRGWRMDGIDKFNHKHGLKYPNQSINPGTPNLKEVIQIVRDSGSGFVGVAHPCRNFGGVDLRYVFPQFKKIGIEAVETNYQYPLDSEVFPKSFQEHVDLAATQSGLLKSGGSDNHSDNIFTNFTQIKNLPKTVQAIILPDSIS